MLVHLVAPAALLIAAGAIAARFATPVADGVRRGSTVAFGYLPLAVLGAVILTASPPPVIWRRGSVWPDLLSSLAVMGLVYPVVFGGLGGWILVRYSSTTA